MNNQIVLVTGANKGIGYATVKLFLEMGYTTILTSRNEERGLKAYNQLKGIGRLYYHQLDVSSQESVNRVKFFVEKEFGKLDVLINNAGINYDDYQTALEADLDHVHETMETNFFGPWRMMKAFIPLMEDGKGRIINVSSLQGIVARTKPTTPGYSASKSALDILTLTMAKQVEDRGILINAIAPGNVKTDMGGIHGVKTPEEGADTIIYAATLPEGGPTGKFLMDREEIDY